MPEPKRSWLVVVKPITDKMNLAAKLGMTYQSGDPSSLAQILTTMATIIDNEIDRRDAKPQEVTSCRQNKTTLTRTLRQAFSDALRRDACQLGAWLKRLF